MSLPRAGLLAGLLPWIAAAAPGDERWRWHLPDHKPTAAAFSAQGDIYVVLNHQIIHADGALFALRADGGLGWTNWFQWPVPGEPTVSPDGRIHLLTSEWHLATVNAQGQFERRLSSYASHPAVDAAGNVFAVHQTDGLQVLSPAGEVLQSFPFRGTLNRFAPVPAPRLFGDAFWLTAEGHVLMGRDGRIFWSSATTSGSGTIQPATALLPDGSGVFSDGDLKHVEADGSLRWRAGRTNVLAPPVAGPDGRLFAATTAGELLAYDAAGSLLWLRDAGATVSLAPAVGGQGVVFVLNDAGRLTAFDPDGSPRWHFDGGAAPAMRPGVSPDGSVLLGFADGHVVLLEGEGSPAGGPWPLASHDAQNTSRAPGALDPPAAVSGLTASGPEVPGLVELRWTSAPRARAYEIWRGGGTDPAAATLIATNAGVTLLYQDATSDYGVTNHYWLRPVNEAGVGPWAGPVAAVQKVRRWSRRFGPVHSAPQILPDGGLVVNTYNAFDAMPPDQGALVVLEEDGRERWRRPLPWGSVTRSSIAADGRIHAMGSPLSDPPLMCFSPNGNLLWSTPIRGQSQYAALAVDEAGTSYVLMHGSSLELVAVDREGHPAWRTFCGSGSQTDFLQHATVLPDGRILVAAGSDLRCFLPGGGLSWRRQLSGTSLNPVPDAEGRIYFRSGPRPLALSSDGIPLWTNVTSLSPQSTETLVGDGVIWFPRGRDRLGLSPAGEVLQVVSNVQASGTVPALDSAGRFVGIVGRELVRADAAGNREVLAVRPGNMESEVVLSPSGRAYVLGVTGSELHAYDVPAGLATNAPWPMFRGDPRGSASRGGRAAPPAVPEGFLAEAFVGQALLRWTASTQQLASATVWRSETADPAAAVPVLIGAYGGYVFDTNAAPGRTYHYWLQAANSAGTSTLTGPLSVTIPEARMAWAHRAASRIRSSVSAADDGPIYYQRDGSLTALDASGQVRWEKFYLDTPGDIQATPPAVGRDGTIHVATLLKLFAFHPDGSPRWAFEAPQGWLSTGVDPPTVGPEGDVYHAAGEWIMAVTPDGRLRWRVEAGSALRHPPVLSPNGVLYVSVFDRSLRALRTTDGALLWQQPWPSTVPPGGLLLDDSGAPLIGVGTGWYRFSPAGWQVFGEPTNSLSSRALRSPDGGFVGWAGTTPTRGELVVLRQDGAPRGRNSLGTQPLVVGTDGTIFGSGARSITPHLAAATPPRPGTALHQAGAPVLHEGVILRTIRAHRSDGALAWEHALPTDAQSATLTHDGLLLVTTLMDVVALQLSVGAPRTGWPVERGNPGQTGTLPGEPLRFSSPSLDGGHLKLLVRGPTGREISLEHTADFTRWATITNTALTNGTTVLRVPLTASPGFFRAR